MGKCFYTGLFSSSSFFLLLLSPRFEHSLTMPVGSKIRFYWDMYLRIWGMQKDNYHGKILAVPSVEAKHRSKGIVWERGEKLCSLFRVTVGDQHRRQSVAEDDLRQASVVDRQALRQGGLLVRGRPSSPKETLSGNRLHLSRYRRPPSPDVTYNDSTHSFSSNTAQ